MKQTRHFLFLLGLLLLGISPKLNAQITITNSVFPVVGDTLHYLIGNQPGAINQIFTPPGGNQSWDLSNLQSSQVWDQIMKDPQTGTAAASFPGASVLFNPVNSSSEVYWQVTDNQINDLGYFGLDELGLGLNLLFKKTPGLEQSWAPVNFFDIHQSSSNVLTAFDAPIAPPILLNLVPTADSFRIRVTYQRIASIDAFGTLAIPGGSFDVLRKKQTEYRSTAVDVKVAPLGWIDISTIGGQQLLPLGTDTITTFHFLNDVSKEPIAICTLNTAQNEVTIVQYKAVNPALSAPLISRIDDGDADDRAAVGDTLTYTVTFNKDIDATTVTAADFNNAGTATISIGAIIETAPGVFTVKVRPTSAGTLILRIPSGAIIADLDGNNLVVPVLDDTTICIPPSIINQPESDSVFTNQTASFFVVASGGGTLSYNWEVLPAGGAVWMDVAPALDGNDTLSVGPLSIVDNGNQYRVVISDSASPSCQPIISNVANLTVLPGPIVGDADTTGQAIGDIIDQFLMETQDPPQIYDPCTCRNNTGIIPSGTFTDDGLFDDEIIVVSPTAGNTWEIAAGTIFPFATNANPSAQPGDLTRVTVGTPLTFIGSVNTMEGVRYIYRLQIIHKDNEGYNVTVRETSNPLYADLLLPIGNRCYYPTPAINGLDATYCVGEPAVTLMGTVDRGDGQTAATSESAV
ncbi:MAG: hypothetical protein ACK4TA_14545, partial [Saprospiraceae bacterium]